MTCFSRLGIFWALCFLICYGCSTYETTPSAAKAFSINDGKEIAPKGAVLEVDDIIEVSVEVDGNMEISHHQAKISYQGIATLPLIGDVEVADLKLDRARDEIAEKYNKYYVNPPVIMISLVDAGVVDELGSVTILGKVVRPGLVPIPSRRGINLSAAVQAAGGFAPSARASRIRVTRVDDNGEKIQVSVNFEEIGEEGNAEADLTLKAGDIVYVPERMF